MNSKTNPKGAEQVREAKHHTRECLHDGINKGCPVCEPINQKLQAKHTPGPWRALGVDEKPHDFYPIQKDGLGIAAVISEKHVYVANPNGKANARLIAAAPELLEVCKLMMVVAHSKGQTILAERIKAAIARAEGK